jgi:3-deoxy-manno-octulosonate cytidylyltransferase (CMP-KDO synthetase)
MQPSPKKVVIIPARLASSRLPDKVILDLGGKPIVQRVYEQAQKAKTIDAVFIATDSDQVSGICRNFTENVIMTRADHPTGTDRIAEAIGAMEADIIINVQGDEPFIDPDVIDALGNRIENLGVPMATVASRIGQVEDLLNPNIVKVTIDSHKNALYFSRSVIPFAREVNWQALTEVPEEMTYYRHFGIYAFQRHFLLGYAAMMPTFLEKTEKLEQLRALENGYTINVVVTDRQSIGIDTEEDLQKARKIAADFFIS